MNWPHAGGFAMIAWARKGWLVFWSGSMHAGRRDSIISFTCLLCVSNWLSVDGIRPLFLAISEVQKIKLIMFENEFKHDIYVG